MPAYRSDTLGLKNLSNTLEVVLGSELWQKIQDEVMICEALHPSWQKLPQRNQIWREHLGMPNPLVPSYLDSDREASCLRCKDQGWIVKRWRDHFDVWHYKQAETCPDCSPEQEARAKRMMAYAGVPETQRLATFETFKKVKGTEDAYDNAQALATGDFEEPFWMLLIYGNVGNGKTHLAYAAALVAIKAGIKAKFCHVSSLMSELRRLMDAKNISADQYISEIKNVGFLVLDDMGAEMGSDWQRSTLEDIINHRYANMLPTIVTTNRDIKGLSAPILSRFRDAKASRITFNEAGDYRPQKRAKS